jgi:hypothetical protein
MPLDTGSERMERLLSGNPLPPAPIEYDLMGATEHVSYALRGEERVQRLGDRFDVEAELPEPVEWAVAAVASAGKGDWARAASRGSRAFTGRFDPCLDYLAVVRAAAPEPGPHGERLLRLCVEKAETYRPHPLLRGDFLADAQTHLAIALVARGAVAEALKLLETIPASTGLSGETVAGAASVALGLDRSPLVDRILALASDEPPVRTVRNLEKSRALPSGHRVVPALPGLWEMAMSAPKDSRECPLCHAKGLLATKTSVNSAPVCVYCSNCRVVACVKANDVVDPGWEGMEKDSDALTKHLQLYPGGSRA